MALDPQIDPARRMTGLLVVAHVDVVGLMAANDADCHGAGDALVQRAADAVRGHVRCFDVIVRIGGDEFQGRMSGTAIKEARAQFRASQAGLAAGPDPCEITVGFAQGVTLSV
jgi:diguanylate cyclase (GGDEF)-like protein